jgi:hypothetical protein
MYMKQATAYKGISFPSSQLKYYTSVIIINIVNFTVNYSLSWLSKNTILMCNMLYKVMYIRCSK